MKRVLVDKGDNIVYEGDDSKHILRILNSDIHSVSEEDELMYLPTIKLLLDDKGNCKYGELTYEVHFNLKFRGIDDWNRPVFKDIDASIYFGDTNKLWGYIELGKDNKDVNKYYKDNPGALEYFGGTFNCEPHGGLPDFFKLNIIE